MGSEIPLQFDMFSDELVDTRSQAQRRKDAAHSRPQQAELFRQRELLQPKARSRPMMPMVNRQGLPLGMQLEIQDPRTEEEKDHDRMKAAEAQTLSFLEEKPPAAPARTKLFPSGLRLALREVEEVEDGLAVALTDNIDILFWSTRDAEYERVRDVHHLAGNEVYLAGDNRLEIRKPDETGSFLITYSDMEMVENVELMEAPR